MSMLVHIHGENKKFYNMMFFHSVHVKKAVICQITP